MPILLCQLKCFISHITRFLNGVRCQYDQVVVTVSTALYCLPVVILTCRNKTITNSETLNACYYAWDFSGYPVSDSFLIQGESRTGCGSESTGAQTASCEGHINAFDFGSTLNEYSAYFLLSPRHPLQNFRLWSNRISRIKTTTATDGTFCHRLVALHDSFFHNVVSSLQPIKFRKPDPGTWCSSIHTVRTSPNPPAVPDNPLRSPPMIRSKHQACSWQCKDSNLCNVQHST